MQFLADILDAPVDRPVFMETTALGAAYLAGRKPAYARSCRVRGDLAARPPLQARDGRGDARAQMGRLASRCCARPDAAGMSAAKFSGRPIDHRLLGCAALLVVSARLLESFDDEILDRFVAYEKADDERRQNHADDAANR